jgi:hypothetical protein
MTLESWSYTADIIYLLPHEDTPFDLRKPTFIENVEWMIVDYTTKSSFEEYTSGNYSTVVYLLYIYKKARTNNRELNYFSINWGFLFIISLLFFTHWNC